MFSVHYSFFSLSLSSPVLLRLGEALGDGLCSGLNNTCVPSYMSITEWILFGGLLVTRLHTRKVNKAE